MTPILEQYGHATSVEWVRLSSPPRKGHLQDVGLLAHGATPVTGVNGFMDYAEGARLGSLGWYVLAAQGRFTTRVHANDSPLPVSTVLVQLHAVSADGSPAVPEIQVRTYEQRVHLDVDGTRAYNVP